MKYDNLITLIEQIESLKIVFILIISNPRNIAKFAIKFKI